MARVMKADQLAAGGPVRVQAMNLRDLADQARTIVLEARKEAAAILAQAQTQAAKTRQEAAQAAEVEGFAKGHAAGLAQGADHGRQTAQTQFRAEVAELSDLAKAIVNELSAARAQTLGQMNAETLNFSLALAAKIVGQVAVADVTAARANLAKVLELACRSGEIVIKVNPRQLRRLQEHCDELVAALAVQGPVRLVGDEAVGPGGVKLVSRSGEIDATIETQLANLAQGLLGGMGELFDPHAAPVPPAANAQSCYVPEMTPRQSAGQGAYDA